MTTIFCWLAERFVDERGIAYCTWGGHETKDVYEAVRLPHESAEELARLLNTRSGSDQWRATEHGFIE